MLTFGGMSNPKNRVPAVAAEDQSPAKAALDKAIRCVGGVPVLADRLSVRRQAIYQWDRVPVERVQAVSSLSGIPPHELRPDIFPPPKYAAGSGEAAQ
jgi:DNA-binding transcriptional regulator YdaS (Cro superfamily)